MFEKGRKGEGMSCLSMNIIFITLIYVSMKYDKKEYHSLKGTTNNVIMNFEYVKFFLHKNDIDNLTYNKF